jgi:site-specific DNA-methyltransferase (adenine-specific)
MVFDWMEWERDSKDIPKIHPTQKPVKLLKRLIEICTDPGDVVIDPCFGSGSTGRACIETGRSFYGFEINKEFYRRAKEEMCVVNDRQMDINEWQLNMAISV